MKHKITALTAFALTASCLIPLSACGGSDFKAVSDNYVTKIEITKPADKLDYYVGDKFDTTGMIVTATYSNGEKKEIKDYTATRTSKSLSVSDNSVTISYQGYSLIQPIYVEDPNADPATVVMALFTTDTYITRMALYKNQTFRMYLEGFESGTYGSGTWSWENKTLTLYHGNVGIVPDYHNRIDVIKVDESDTMTYDFYFERIGHWTITCSNWQKKLGDNIFPKVETGE